MPEIELTEKLLDDIKITLFNNAADLDFARAQRALEVVLAEVRDIKDTEKIRLTKNLVRHLIDAKFSLVHAKNSFMKLKWMKD